MLNLIRLWSVTYTLENGKKAKAKFYTFEKESTGEKIYKIQNESVKLEKQVSKEEGNDYFKEILNYDKNAIVNKVV